MSVRVAIEYDNGSHLLVFQGLDAASEVSRVCVVYAWCGEEEQESEPLEIDNGMSEWAGEIQGIDFQPGESYEYQVEMLINDGSNEYYQYYPSSGTQTYECPSERPSDFEWDIEKNSGEPIRVSADEWNRFCKKINEFREYLGLNTVDFTAVKSAGLTRRNVATSYDGLSSNQIINADIIGEAIDALNDMSSLGYSDAGSGKLSAELFNDLRDALNSID